MENEIIVLNVNDDDFLPHVKGDLFHVIRQNQDSPYVIGYWEGDDPPQCEDDEVFVRVRFFKRITLDDPDEISF